MKREETNMNKLYKISARIYFPEGVSPGASTLSNVQRIARNGLDESVLRGTALTGVLRSAYAQYLKVKSSAPDVKKWFGSESQNDVESSSKIIVSDCVIDCGTTNLRTHNQVNRHTGAVAKGALFSLEELPPQSETTVSITVKNDSGDDKQALKFIRDISSILESDLIVGGSSNRGIGRLKVKGDIHMSCYDLDNIDGTSSWMDAEYKERLEGVQVEGERVEVKPLPDRLTINIELGVPRGEDFLIGDGQETDYALQPQKVIFQNGKQYWRVPGSSLRGVFRGWITRLAARDGKQVHDSHEQWSKHYDDDQSEEYKPDLIGWGFKNESDRNQYKKDPSLLQDPILDLFGSMYKKGRIHITDSFSVNESTEVDIQERMHVAVDRFSGGANEGALYNNQVFMKSNDNFPLSISVIEPTSDDINWLLKTLRALHLGILLVGSSKSSGRLEIKKIAATGDNFEIFEKFGKEIINA